MAEQFFIMDMNSGSPARRMVWTGSATTTTGVATFYPTDDGTANGNPLFASISSVVVTSRLNTGTAVAIPVASVKLVASDRKSITANVIVGKTLLVLGDTVALAPDGTVCDIIVVGY